MFQVPYIMKNIATKNAIVPTAFQDLIDLLAILSKTFLNLLVLLMTSMYLKSMFFLSLYMTIPRIAKNNTTDSV